MTDGSPAQRPPLHRWWVSYVLVGAAAILAVLAALQMLAEVLRPVRGIALVLLFAIVLAFVLAPLVDMLEQRVRKRAIAVIITFLVVIGVLAAAIALLAGPFIAEGRKLATQMPVYAAQLQSPEPITIGAFEIPANLKEQAAAALRESGSAFAGQAAGVAFGVFNGILNFLLVIVISLYLLADARRIREFPLRVLPPRLRPRAEQVEYEVTRVFGRYIRAQLLLGVIVGTITTLALLALGVPYAFLLGVIAGVLELVPIIGPIISAVPAVIVALFYPFPLVLWVILLYIAVQQLENHILVPRISGGAVGLHPLAAMLSLLIGLQVGGIIGGLFAVPFAAVLWAFAAAWLRSRDEAAGAGRTPQVETA